MEQVTASCVCGKTYTGYTHAQAEKRLQTHSRFCDAWKKAKESEAMNNEPQPTKEPEAIPTPNLNPHLTADERAIADRVMGDSDTSWHTITEGDMEDFSLQRDPMELPPPAKLRQEEEKYAFHWAQLEPRRIDQLTKLAEPPMRWSICNRMTAPWLEGYFNDALGCVVREDCILLMKPWHHHMRVKARKTEQNKAYELTSGLNRGKQKIAERDDLQTFDGPQYKIGKGDEVITDEAEMEMGEGEGDLVE